MSSERPKIVALCPRRAGWPDRDRLWSFVRAHWAKHLPDVELFEGHHHAHEGPFNRSAAVNRAALEAGAWDAAMVIDADTLLDPTSVRVAFERALGSGGPVLAYRERGQLSRQGSERILAGFRGNWRPLVKTRSDYGGFLYDSCSGALVLRRDLWDELGGFDELFAGWGWEDVAMRCASETVSGLELEKIDSTAWHLWHVVSSGNNPNEPTFVANEERGNRYVAARWDRDATELLLEEARQARGPIVAPPAPSSTTIPKILHRTVPAETSADVERYWRAWGDLHPGWILKDHRDPLEPADWPETSDLWNLCTSGAQRAGLIRLEAIWRDGGVYVDSDVEPYRPLDALLGLDGFAGWEDAKVIPDAVFGARPHHPAVAIMLERAREAIVAGRGAWDSGPGVFTETLPARADWLLLPPGTFYPYHYKRKAEERGLDHARLSPWALGAHHWHASWLPA